MGAQAQIDPEELDRLMEDVMDIEAEQYKRSREGMIEAECSGDDEEVNKKWGGGF